MSVPIDQIVIIYGGKQLQNGKILSDYNMTPESTAHLVLRFEGGNWVFIHSKLNLKSKYHLLYTYPTKK